nr:PQQ-dependent sugar dehydrogenase [uncultured Dyadobacter sp.]
MKLSLSITALIIMAAACCLAQPAMVIEPVVSGFTRPVKVTNGGDSRLFVAEIGGKIRIVKNGAIVSQPFLDIGAKVNNPDWAGIFSIAFDPAYQANGHFYVLYVVKDRFEVQVSRFSRSAGDADLADPNSEQKVLTIPYTDVLGGHRGGDMAFGKDGFLYISTGDNGPGSRGVTGDPENNAQNTTRLYGKLLRIDVVNALPVTPTPDKIFALGLRNPWRFSIDRLNGDFWIGDNGQDGWEEVNYLKYPFEVAAPNFGWSCLEGNQSYTASHCAPGTTYQAPRVTYPGFTNNGGLDASVMGGYVYRGSRYPSLKGYYFFGDYTSGKIGFVNPSGIPTVNAGLSYPSVISFGENQAGELYLLSFLNGTLARMTSPDDPLPVKLVFFRPQWRERSLVLEWKTSFESNFADFELERSTDGHHFKLLDHIAPLGAGRTYSFPDSTPTTKTSYYRLKMTDLDGSYAYSKIVAGIGGQDAELLVYPNPVSHQCQIEGIRKGARIALYNAAGDRLWSGTSQSDSRMSLDLSGRVAGIYTVIIEDDAAGFQKSIKIIRK